jgi:hypothetical protein
MSGSSRNDHSIFKRTLIGGAVILVITLISMLAVGAVALLTEDPLSFIGKGAIITVVISSSLSGVILSRLSGGAGIGSTMLSGILFISFILIIGLIISGGGIGGGAVFNSLIYLATLLVSAFLSSHKRGKRKRKH